MASLPNESASDLRAQAKLTDGDLVLARQFVGTMASPGPYLDKGKLKRVDATLARALFNAKPLSNKTSADAMYDFHWVNARQQFASSQGVLVKPEIAKGAANAAAREARIRLMEVSNRLEQGTIDVAEWWKEMKATTKVLDAAETALGYGGFDQFTPDEYPSVEEIIFNRWNGVEGQFPGMRAFAEDVAKGRYGTPGDGMRPGFLQRSGLHANAGNLTYENARIASHDASPDFTEGCRLKAAVASCATCIAEDGIWRPILQLVGYGDCECGGNCHCTTIFR